MSACGQLNTDNGTRCVLDAGHLGRHDFGGRNAVESKRWLRHLFASPNPAPIIPPPAPSEPLPLTAAERRNAFTLNIIGSAHENGLGGSDLAAAMLAVVAIMFSDNAAGNSERYAELVNEAAEAFWGNPKAPPRPTDPGQILSDDELAAHWATVRASIRWTKGPRATVDRSLGLILAELRRLRAAR